MGLTESHMNYYDASGLDLPIKNPKPSTNDRYIKVGDKVSCLLKDNSTFTATVVKLMQKSAIVETDEFKTVISYKSMWKL